MKTSEKILLYLLIFAISVLLLVTVLATKEANRKVDLLYTRFKLEIVKQPSEVLKPIAPAKVKK